MRAAIYARKSNDDNDKSVDNKSITRQIERAKAYAEAKGWVVDDDHVYFDDGISGAEYAKRPGLQNMLAHAKDFDVLVASESSRLGREQLGNNYVFSQLQKAKVKIYLYLNDEELPFDTAIDVFMANVQSFVDEMERERIGQRTRDTLSRKAEKGHSAGGRCYGYDLVPVYGTSANGERERTHTDFAINEQQAEVVRGIFKMYADGFGTTAIAKTLNGADKYMQQSLKYFNGEEPTPPQVQTGKSPTWGPTCIRAMLYRKRYAGILEYGATKQKAKYGNKVISVERPELRIIDEVLWAKVQKRLQNMREAYLRDTRGKLFGRPDAGRESKYLLSGISKCSICGGNITVLGGQKHRHYYYGCALRDTRGKKACTNTHRVDMPTMDALFLQALQEQALTPDAVDYVIKKALELVKERTTQRVDRVPQLQKELRRVERELANFMHLIASGDAPQSIMTEIKQREARKAALERELGQFDEQPPVDVERFRKRAKQLMSDFSGLVLNGNVQRTRQALRKLLRDENGEFAPILMTPAMAGNKKIFAFEGAITLVGPLLYNSGAEERT